jgi:hypothetical protein
VTEQPVLLTISIASIARFIASFFHESTPANVTLMIDSILYNIDVFYQAIAHTR